MFSDALLSYLSLPDKNIVLSWGGLWRWNGEGGGYHCSIPKEEISFQKAEVEQSSEWVFR